MLAVVIGDEPAASHLQIGQPQIAGRATDQPDVELAVEIDGLFANFAQRGRHADGGNRWLMRRQVVAQQAVLQDAEEPAAGAALRSVGGLMLRMMMLLAPSSLICCWAW